MTACPPIPNARTGACSQALILQVPVSTCQLAVRAVAAPALLTTQHIHACHLLVTRRAHAPGCAPQGPASALSAESELLASMAKRLGLLEKELGGRQQALNRLHAENEGLKAKVRAAAG